MLRPTTSWRRGAWQSEPVFSPPTETGSAGAGDVRLSARVNIGSVEVVSLLDGVTMIDDTFFPTATADRAAALRMAAGIEGTGLPLPTNVFLFDLSGRRILIDAGNNKSHSPASGRLQETFAAVGIDPSTVDTIVVTHAHIDHITGLLSPEGAKIYPNAEIFIPKAELEFWFDEAKLDGGPPHITRVVKLILPTLKAYEDQFRPFEATPEVLPGLTAVPIYGHSPAQTGYLLESGAEKLLFWADTVHLGAYQLPQPDWSIVFDYDQEAAVATRKRMLEAVAADGMMVAGAHLPAQGFGTIERDGGGYRFVPTLA